MVNKDKFSKELLDVLHYMENNIATEELPTVVITPEYFFLAILQSQNCDAYNSLYRSISQTTLEAIEISIVNFLSSKALSAIKPSREQRYDDKLYSYLEKADEERKKLNKNEITTEHVLLAILADDSPTNKVKKIINAKHISYYSYLENIKYTEKIKKEKEENKNLPKVVPIDLSQYPNGQEIFQKLITGQISPEEVLKMNLTNTPNNIIINSNIPPGMLPNNGNNNSYINTYCTNLNSLAENNNIDTLIGREKETEEIIRILGRRKKNNAILVGANGIGKTAIGENIASKIVSENVPDFLLNKIVVSLDFTALQAGTTLRGMFEERVKGLLNEMRDSKNYILFIDNIGDVFGNRDRNDYDISGMLSHSLENGEIQVIGTCDYSSFRKVFDKNQSLARKFQKITVESPTIEESIEIVNGVKHYYEDYHKVHFTDEAIKSCVELSNRYITERNLPDSAIDVLDEAGAIIGTSADSLPEIKQLKKQHNNIKFEIQKEKDKENYKRVDELEKIEKSILTQISEKTENHKKNRIEKPEIIDENIIYDIISKKTNIPVSKLTSDDKKRLININERLKEEVIGQNEAIDTICKALKRNRIGLSNNKCLYSAIMIGRSGIGKTLIAKKLAKEIFGTENALIRFDMSEYHDKTAVNKLIGSNPGYVGYEEGGLLTEAVKNKKYCVLLLDEIEKADPEVYNIFLQVLDEGFLTDNSGMHVDFKNVIVLFTSNVGTKTANEFSKGIGFSQQDNSKKILLKELKNKFPPEFINRLQNVIYFNNLTDDNLKDIIKLELNKLKDRLIKIGYNITYDDNTVDYLLEIAKEEKEYGARPIARAIQDEIEDKITDLLLEHDYENNYIFEVTYPFGIALDTNIHGIVKTKPLQQSLIVK